LARQQGSGSRATTLNSALRRGLVLTLVLGLLGATLGALLGQRLASASTATATILVNPLDGNPFSTRGSGDDLINLETEAQLVRSEEVGTLVQREIGGGVTVAELLQDVEVTIPPNTQILQIDYDAASADEAARRAQAFADNYLAYRQSRAEGLITNQTRRIDEQIAQRSQEQTDLARRLNKADPDSTQANVLRVQLEAVTTQLNQLQARSAELQAGSTNPGQIVTPAAVPPVGLFGSWPLYALVGLLLGLATGALLARLLARRGERPVVADPVEAPARENDPSWAGWQLPAQEGQPERRRRTSATPAEVTPGAHAK
jgi:hypothetical protein